MREIKFRAWDGKDMLNIDHWTLSMINQHIPENHVIMQYTGLKDKHGKEIYGGDKIRITAAKDMYTDDSVISMKKGELLEELTVIFYKGAFWLGSDFIPDKHLLKMIIPDSNWQGEIIGTIHDSGETKHG